MTLIIRLLRRLMCGIRGHEAAMHFEPDRLSLRCLNCGYETAGWILYQRVHRPALLTDDVEHAQPGQLEQPHRTFDRPVGVSLADRRNDPGHATS